MHDVVYCRDPDDVHVLPGAAEGIRALAGAGYLIVIVTNQSGVGRGLITVSELDRVNERLRSELRARGAEFDALYYCPHTPDDHCSCRKPMPGLLLRAASELDIDLPSSYSIGDREWDVEAGQRAGTKTVLIAKHPGKPDSPSHPDFVAEDVKAAAAAILGTTSAPKQKPRGGKG